jgi:uncharacterized coiled-coil DUF342 family protein
MVRVAPKGKETIINVGTGIEVAIRNEGEYRINWAKIDENIYVHKEIHAELEKKHKNLNRKYRKLNEKVEEFDEKYKNLENDRDAWLVRYEEVSGERNRLAAALDSWKTKLVISNLIWFFLTLGLTGVIGYLVK